MSISLLPDDAKYAILMLLDYANIMNWCKTDKTFNMLCHNEFFWRDKIQELRPTFKLNTKFPSRYLMKLYKLLSTDGVAHYIRHDNMNNIFNDVFRKIKNVVQLACGEDCCILVDVEGTVYGFGSNRNGKLGFPWMCSFYPVRYEHLSGIIKVVSVNDRTLFLTDYGDVFCCGKNTHGELGIGESDSKEIPLTKIMGLSDIIDIACGLTHTAGVAATGEVYTFGYNGYGQLGLSDNHNRSYPVKVPDISDVVEVACGDHHTICLNSKGEIFMAGSNHDYQLGIPDKQRCLKFEKNNNLSNISQISCGNAHTACLTTAGKVIYFGKLFAAKVAVQHPTEIDNLSDVVQITCTGGGILCLSKFGDVYLFGSNDLKYLHFSLENYIDPPVNIRYASTDVNWYKSNMEYITRIAGTISNVKYISNSIHYPNGEVDIAFIKNS